MRSPLAAGLLFTILAGAACNAEPPMPPNTPSSGREHAASTSESARTPVAGAAASPVDFEMIARFPEPGWQVPRAIAFSPDGKEITYLQSEAFTEQMALHAFDVDAGTPRVMLRARDILRDDKPLSREEELRRERQRQKTRGIVDYAWAKRANAMLLPLGGDLFFRSPEGVVTRLTDTTEPELDPKLCDDGSAIGFVRKGELVMLDVKANKEIALTQSAPEGVTRGLSDFLAQEEFDEPSGFWWSPQCDRVAYLEVDERVVEPTPVMGYRGKKPDLMQQRYPRPGGRNALVKVAVLDVKTKKTIWLKVPENFGSRPPAAVPDGDRYLGRFQWGPIGQTLWFQSLSRDQKRLAFLRADPTTGAVTELWAEGSSTWVPFRDMRLLEKSPRAVVMSANGGHVHLEVRDTGSGERVTQLTSGDWDVEAIRGIDEERGLIFFTGTMSSPVERHLYSVPLGGGEVKKITTEPGVHAVTMSRDAKRWVDVHSAANRLPKAVVHGPSGQVAEIPVPADPDLPRLNLRTPELVTVKASDGTTLYGSLLPPRNIEPGRKYPVIVMVYGGPGVQMVLDQWAPRLLWQHLADRGFVVFQLDNRGTSGRGPAFEAPIYKRLGEIELADQLAGVNHLKTLSYVDPNRIGIYGHSYGGFMAALATLKAPDTFKVGVAGSPVTEWSLYDSAYTERYMDTPASNLAGYEAADLARLAPGLKGQLFLIHALMDENVHFDHTAHLVDALIGAGKTFDQFVFPGERHGYRSPAARKFALSRVVDYFVEHL